MPAPQEILDQLTRIANEARIVAIGWHAVFAVAFVALRLGWRPSPRLAALLLLAPLVSVSAAAWYFGNPFNGAMFALAASVLAILALRAGPQRRLERDPRMRLGLSLGGAVLLALGWFYPHFVETDHVLVFLYAAPLGLVPCPTLAMVIGCALVSEDLADRAWAIALGAFGLFYGLFGAIRLGVTIDLVLAAGAALLLWSALRSWRARMSAQLRPRERGTHRAGESPLLPSDW